MNKVVLARDRCVRCGHCCKVCPVRVFGQSEYGKVDVLEPNLPRCIGCGQCVAVCHRAAISLNDVNPLSLEKVEKAPLTDVQRSMLFKARRSVRVYREEPLPFELVSGALEDARYAPTATNAQEVEWMLVEGRERLHDIAARVVRWAGTLEGPYARITAAFEAGEDPVLRGAPGLILAHAPAGSPFAPHDCSAALSYLELSLHSRGAGSCWAGYVLAAARAGVDLGLALPQGRAFFAGLMIGWPELDFSRLPPRRPVRLARVGEDRNQERNRC